MTGLTIVAVHDGVNERVEDNKDPNRSSLVVDTGPHSNHCTSMMISLKKRRTTTFKDDDNGINDFIKLGEVEKVSPVTKSIIPKTLVSITILICYIEIKCQLFGLSVFFFTF
jgi:hypothetical protein